MNTATTAAGIEQAVESWRPILLGVDAEAAFRKLAPDRWSIAEVVGHLVDSACNNHQWFVRAQFCEELHFPKYEQNEWVSAGNYQNSDWESLVQLWYHYNRQLATLIRVMPDARLSTTCTIGPYDPCTLGFLVTDYLDHLNHHLEKLRERLDLEEAT